MPIRLRHKLGGSVSAADSAATVWSSRHLDVGGAEADCLLDAPSGCYGPTGCMVAPPPFKENAD